MIITRNTTRIRQKPNILERNNMLNYINYALWSAGLWSGNSTRLYALRLYACWNQSWTSWASRRLSLSKRSQWSCVFSIALVNNIVAWSGSSLQYKGWLKQIIQIYNLIAYKVQSLVCNKDYIKIKHTRRLEGHLFICVVDCGGVSNCMWLRKSLIWLWALFTGRYFPFR